MSTDIARDFVVEPEEQFGLWTFYNQKRKHQFDNSKGAMSGDTPSPEFLVTWMVQVLSNKTSKVFFQPLQQLLRKISNGYFNSKCSRSLSCGKAETSFSVENSSYVCESGFSQFFFEDDNSRSESSRCTHAYIHTLIIA